MVWVEDGWEWGIGGVAGREAWFVVPLRSCQLCSRLVLKNEVAYTEREVSIFPAEGWHCRCCRCHTRIVGEWGIRSCRRHHARSVGEDRRCDRGVKCAGPAHIAKQSRCHCGGRVSARISRGVAPKSTPAIRGWINVGVSSDSNKSRNKDRADHDRRRRGQT